MGQRSVLATLAGALMLAPPALAAPPANDSYQAAVTFNDPGTPLTRDTVTTPPKDASEATLQADLLNPPGSGGPPEPDACNGTPIDHTLWYRFFPDEHGTVTLQSTGFDSTIALIPFESVASPLPQGETCANLSDDPIETLSAPVDKGAYAVQVGGVNGAAGMLQLRLTFTPDADGDGVPDDEDDCPTRAGTVNGCPPTIVALITSTFGSAPGGVKLHSMRIRDVPRGAKLLVTCSHGCKRFARTLERPQVTFRPFNGRVFAPGDAITVRVTKAGFVGDYRKFSIVGRKVKVQARCLPVGSKVPKRKCKSEETS